MNHAKMVIEKEAPEEYGYDRIRYHLCKSSIADQKLSDIGLSVPDLTLFYGEHRDEKELRALIAGQDKGLAADDVPWPQAPPERCSSLLPRCCRPATISSSRSQTTPPTSRRPRRSAAPSAMSISISTAASRSTSDASRQPCGRTRS